ncbi:uncharacterized protein LOC132278749 [Cornus florida]|uniref:uncharacterized protein LOC132278749 n=1 Tax=Cornus florida TaxID=4283 RepID=UPI00289A08C5|nr:uncharacterized protein LOC132278749 [Cornus florida]
MGTKIQYAIDPLAASPNNNFDVNWLGDWDNFLNKKGPKLSLESAALNKFHNSTDRMLDQHNIESIKKTMLMHEDVFKHQVQELHRLYRVQKMLMNEVKNGVKQTRSCGPMTGSEFNYSNFSNRHQPTTTSDYTPHVQRVRDNLSSREPSGCCSGEPSRMFKAFDLEKPAEEDVSTGIRAVEEDQAGPSSHRHPNSNKMNINECNEGCDIELTLSIGGSFGSKRSKSHQHYHHSSPELGGCSSLTGNKFGELGSSGSIKTDREEECNVPNSNLRSPSATILNQQSKRPHWLFQDLSLNRT